LMSKSGGLQQFHWEGRAIFVPLFKVFAGKRLWVFLSELMTSRPTLMNTLGKYFVWQMV
jgi:hypothetical protein